MVMGPEVACAGTVVVRLVALDELTCAQDWLNSTLSFEAVGWNPEPVTLTTVPAAPIVGEKPVIDGAPTPVCTINGEVLVTVFEPIVTVMGPLVAPLGTVTMSSVDVAEMTVAATPLIMTVFAPGVVEKPVPLMVSVEPGAPWLEVNPETASVVSETVCSETILPTES